MVPVLINRLNKSFILLIPIPIYLFIYLFIYSNFIGFLLNFFKKNQNLLKIYIF